MVQRQGILSVPILWREKKFVLELNLEVSLKELGEELQKVTDVKADTMKLIVPQSSSKASRLLVPFSYEHSSLKLQDIEIVEGKPLRMMGVSQNEVDQFLKDAKSNLRIAGFEEEERRMKARISRGPQFSLKLPPGPYIFCGFRTLEIPGIELNPPPSEALKRMHMLAADPGIVAIMNKHHWRVGIMTEMEPVGYVGVSPTCILGLNKNHGEEISLRLRTDDLKGFRKYERIKQTLLHELAHMVHSEHDEHFYALDKQLNQEAFALDWTKSRGHTLADTQFMGHDDLDMDFELESSLPQKLGGETSVMAASARAASVTAAYQRISESSITPVNQDSNVDAIGDLRSVGALDEDLDIGNHRLGYPHKDKLEPDPDDLVVRDTMALRHEINDASLAANQHIPNETHSDDIEMRAFGGNLLEEPDPDDSEVCKNGMAVDTDSSDSRSILAENNMQKVVRTTEEPDPDDTEATNIRTNMITHETINDSRRDESHCSNFSAAVDSRSPQEITQGQVPDSQLLGLMADEPDPDDEELRRIRDPVAVFCDRLTKAIELLRTELNASEAMMVQQTLFKVIRNLSENPNDRKYKRLRKANPVFQRTIAYCKAALEVLFLVGFVEEVVTDEMGKAENYLVFKRNDPGLLWLAKSSLETTTAN